MKFSDKIISDKEKIVESKICTRRACEAAFNSLYTRACNEDEMRWLLSSPPTAQRWAVVRTKDFNLN